MKVLLASLAGIFLVATSAVAQQTPLQGNWETVQACGSWSQTNILRFKSATPKRILGSTHVGNNSGKVVDGRMKGRNFQFKITFVAHWLDGKTYTEIWTGKLSRNGKSISGKYASNYPDTPKGCTFKGKRM